VSSEICIMEFFPFDPKKIRTFTFIL